MLRELSPAKVKEAITALGPVRLEELKYDWNFWARDNQLEPAGKDWNTWFINAGRGFGKTRAGVEWVREQVKAGKKRIAAVASTNSDIERVMVKGESGLLRICWKGDKTYNGKHMGFPEWSPTKRTLSWSNGAKVEFFSAEEPERLRGPQFEAAWCFTKGHMVTMSDLTVKDVSEVSAKDYVLTSDGPNIVEKTMQRLMPVGCVTLSDGTTLEGTYDHPVFTQNGFVPLGELKESDFCITMGSTGKSTHKGTTPLLESAPYTDMLQERTSVTYPVLTYTTSTETSSTTNQATYNHSQDQITLNSTMENGAYLNQVNPLVQESSVVTTAGKKYLGKQNLGSEFRVKLAQTEEQMRGARPQSSASTVEQALEVSQEPYAVSVVSTWLPTGVKTVYNLQVENTHEYFVNGVLTHNCDETAAWNKDIDTWAMLQFCMRLGSHPRILVTTTPKPTKLIRKIIKDPKTVITTGSTFDNAANLADTYLQAVKDQYEGTRLGRQELYAEILEEAEGALWTVDTIEDCKVTRSEAPNLNRIVVAIDPAVTANKESDLTGIVVSGVDVNGHGYVLGDYTLKGSPQQWASKAIELYHKFDADRIIAEVNQGGDMVKTTIHGIDDTIPYKAVRASRGKYARAEPISAMYERGLIHHVKDTLDSEATLGELETQMTTWEPLGSIGSPDRLDALVWSMTELMLNGVQRPQIAIVYASSKGSS